MDVFQFQISEMTSTAMLFIAVATLLSWTLTDAAFSVSAGTTHVCAVNEGEGVECWVSVLSFGPNIVVS